MKKRLISALLLVAIILPVFVFPASAADLQPLGNGYEGFTVWLNNKPYSASISISYDPNLGGRVHFSTLAAVEVFLSAPEVKYETINYGFITDVGQPKHDHITPSSYGIATAYVPCSLGMDQVVECVEIRGSVLVIAGNNQYSRSVYGQPLNS